MKKTLSTILLIGALGLGITGCNKEEQGYYEKAPKSTKSYEFKEYGVLDNLGFTMQWANISQIEAVDLDNDGDLDLVIGTEDGRIILYENKMPQKND